MVHVNKQDEQSMMISQTHLRTTLGIRFVKEPSYESSGCRLIELVMVGGQCTM